MKKLSLDIPMVMTACRTAGALIAGNGVVQLITGAPTLVVLELLLIGAVVIVLTSLNLRK
jgi:hypothetical protein